MFQCDKERIQYYALCIGHKIEKEAFSSCKDRKGSGQEGGTLIARSSGLVILDISHCAHWQLSVQRCVY